MTAPPEVRPMSPKQKRSFLRAASPEVSVSIFEGSVRAGKTFSWLWLIIGTIMSAGNRGAIMVVGKNRDSIYRNVFEPIETEDLFAMYRPFVSYRQGAPTAKIFGKTVHVIGANDAGAESRIRGMTVQLAFCDEVTVLHMAFFKQLLARMSLDWSKLFGTTNPDSPAHWLRAEYLTKVPDCRHFDPKTAPEEQLHDWYIEHFVMDDNPSLGEVYKSRMRREYTGLWYRRFILGEWVSAEGAIYDMWDTTRHVVSRDALPPMSRILGMGMDYGSTNPTAGVMLGLGEDRRLYVLSEWAPRKGSTDGQLADQLEAWLQTQPEPEWLFLDPSAKSFHLELYQRGHHNLAKADNEVGDGIRTVASLLAADKLRVVDTCTNLIGEIPGYRWDDKASEKGEDKPVKTADHFVDGARYAIFSTRRFWQPTLQEAT